jgi:two-component system sensor histidine kinase KdpD
MLREAHDMKEIGKDIVIGYIEPHARKETLELLEGLESLEPKHIIYKGIELREFDLDKALSRKPEILLVDELAHTNASGQRHTKRWQDVEELLDAGIDVFTTLNVQHIESLNDIVESITHIAVRETIPDKVFDEADNVELIDIESNELLERFSEGKVYGKEQTKKAFGNFFTKNNLYALREIALRRTADRVNLEVESVRLSKGRIIVMPTSDQILACISPSPSSLRVIRTAARMAEVYHSRWVALYVETSKASKLNKEEKTALNANFALVEELGGDVFTAYDDNVVEQIIQYAEFKNISKIIIGKNHRKTRNLFHVYAKDIVDKLMEYNSYIDVYVIPSVSRQYKNKSSAFNIRPLFKVSLNGVLKAIIVMAISSLLAMLFYNAGFAEANIIMVFILGTIIVYAVTSGYLMGIISSITGIMIFNYFFTEPRFSFQFYNKSYIATFPMMLIVSSIIGTLTNRIQRESEASFARENRTQILYSVSKKLLSARGTSEVTSIGIEYISKLINRGVVCYLANKDALSAPYVYNLNKGEKVSLLINKEEEAVAYWSYINGKESGTGTNTFFGAKGYYMPINGQNRIIGVIGVSCIEGILDPEEKYLFETLVSQIAIALDREFFSTEQETSKIEIERERLRSDLLRAISHDLRSPLAGIKGSISTILENGEGISKETEKILLQGVFDDTEWLIRLVENLLSMTSFDEGKMKIKKTLELVEEVLTEAVQRSSKHFKNHKIKVNLPNNYVMAPMDGSLIEQVIINLIDNAIKYSPEESLITVSAYEKGENIVFEVEDNGEGVSKEILPFIFDRFFTNGSKISDSRRGVGLGLAICKAIVETHGGKIEAVNKKDGGAIFRFNIPKEEKEHGK